MIIIAVTFAIDALVFLLFKNVIDQTVLNMFSILLNSVALFYVFKKSTQSKTILVFLVLSYLIRLGYLFFDIYANGTYLLLKDYIDSMGFHMQAEQVLNGTLKATEANKGNYVVFLSIFYRIIGINKFMGQYLNVLLSMSTQLIFIKIVRYLNIKETKIIVPMAVICFLPASILFSAMLVRESILIFAIVASIYFFIRWIKEQRFYYFLFCITVIISAAVLHSGFLIMILTYIFIYAFYDKNKKKLEFKWKSILIIAVTSVVLILFYIVFKGALFEKFGVIFNGNMRHFYRHLQFNKGGSAYLNGIKYKSIWDVIKYSPFRIFQYLLSPVPWMWRGFKDAGVFLVDSLFYFTFLCIWIPLFIKTKKENRLLFIVFSVQFFILTIVFAHGTYTAGTAIRHRLKSLFILATVYILSGDGDPFNLNMWPGKIKKFIVQKKRSA